MSVADILTEFPKLTTADLRSVHRKLIELTAKNEEVAACDAVALEGAQTLDRLEAEDDAR